MLIGYARVSTDDQNLDLQRAALTRCRLQREFTKKSSRARTATVRNWPGCSTICASGDVVVVYRLDRLARSTRDLLDIAEQIKEAEAGLRSLSEPWADTTSPAGRMVLTVFAGIAEFERALIHQRTGAGRAAARARGVRFGRPPKLTAEQRRCRAAPDRRGHRGPRDGADIECSCRPRSIARSAPAAPSERARPVAEGPRMSRWEHRYLGRERFPDALSAMEIEHFFALGEDEFAAVRRRRRVLNRLALALQIGFLKMTGGTLNSVEIIPPGCWSISAASWDAHRRGLPRSGRSTGGGARCSTIRRLPSLALGRTEPSEHAERGLVAYLRREAAAVFDNAELMARSRSWLVDHDYLLLREREIRRLVGAARRHQEQTLFKTIAARCRARPRDVVAAPFGADRGWRDQPPRMARRRAAGQGADEALKPRSRRSAF